jgi:hypothetical protein
MEMFMGAKRIPNVVVMATRIISTNRVIFSAWEPSSLAGHHMTVTHHEDLGWLGRIGAKRIPPEINALPPGEERGAKVRAFYAAENDRAYAAIIDMFDDPTMGERLRSGKCSTGEIEIEDL